MEPDKSERPPRECRYDLILFDCDGVLWKDEHMEEKADQLVLALRKRDIGVSFITNNSTLTKEDLIKKLARCGITAHSNEVASSASGLPCFLKRKLKEKGDNKESGVTVFVMGMPSIRRELESNNISVIEPEEMRGEALATWAPPKVDAIVVGLDLKSTYSRISQTVQVVVTNPDALFIATNRDRLFPMKGKAVPGAAAFVGAVVSSVGKEPLVVGKPEPNLAHEFIEAWRESHGGAKPCVLVVGDNPETDIGFGKAVERVYVPESLGGCDTCHITSGIQIPPKIQPTFSATNVAVLLEMLEGGKLK